MPFISYPPKYQITFFEKLFFPNIRHKKKSQRSELTCMVISITIISTVHRLFYWSLLETLNETTDMAPFEDQRFLSNDSAHAARIAVTAVL